MKAPCARLSTTIGLIALLLVPIGASHAAKRTPVVLYESVLSGLTIHDSGKIALGPVDVAFAPDGPVKAYAAVVDKDGQVIGSVPFAESYRQRDGVFGRITTSAHRAITLDEPGLYALAFVIDDKPVTRFPFLMRAMESGDDLFADPATTLFGDGRWRQLAHIRAATYRNKGTAIVTMWLGKADLPAPDTHYEPIVVSVRHEGEVIAHSKRRTEGIRNTFFETRRIFLFHPHTEKESANAELLPMSELTRDGSYEMVVQRTKDEKVVRRFRFTVTNGKIDPLPQTQADYEPRLDYIVPRVRDGGGQFVQTSWIASE